LNREEFEHVLRAAAAIVDDELVVIGSQAVLGQHPDAPESLLQSAELDVYPRTHPERAGEIDGSIGDGSTFHDTFDYYAHGVGPESPSAPAGWEGRLIRIEVPLTAPKKGTAVAWCMEVHDLVLAKLAAGRPHDLEFAEEAIRSSIVDRERLHLGVNLMREDVRELVRERLVGAMARIDKTG
jgi:hypothetical protein